MCIIALYSQASGFKTEIWRNRMWTHFYSNNFDSLYLSFIIMIWFFQYYVILERETSKHQSKHLFYLSVIVSPLYILENIFLFLSPGWGDRRPEPGQVPSGAGQPRGQLREGRHQRTGKLSQLIVLLTIMIIMRIIMRKW